MNDNLRRMRAALSGYQKKARDAEQEIKRISDEMKPEIARERISQIKADLNAARLAAVDQIAAAAKNGRSEAEKWGELNPADFTDDVKLLQSGINLTQKEYDNLCLKYQNNGSMSRVLSEYADQRNRANKNGLDGLIYKAHLATVEKKAEPWDRLERSAERIIGNIDGSGFGMGADNPIVSASVDQFGSTMGELYE